jgi:hypothetical protein
VRQPRQEVRARRGHHDAVGPAREFDVPHRRLGRGIPQVAAHRPARERLERGRADEVLRALRHYDLDLGALLAQASDEFGALVGSDAAGDAEQDFEGGWSAHGPIMGRRQCGPQRDTPQTGKPV